MKKVLIGLGAICVVVLGIYIGFSIYFNSHYLFNTTINNIDCSKEDPSFVIGKCESIADDYLLTITDKLNNRFHIRGIDIDFRYVPLGEEEAILESQNSWAWPKSLWTPTTYSLSTSVTYDKDKYHKVFDSLELFSESYVEKPQDSYIELKEDDFEVVPEVPGNELKPDITSQLIEEALISQSSTVSLNEDCYVKPVVAQTDSIIAKPAETLNKYLHSTIRYQIDGEDVMFTKKHIMSMVSLEEDGSISLNEAVPARFAQNLASKYNTYADVRSFKTSKGDTIKIGGGDYGWVVNKPAEAAQILEDIQSGAPVEREPIYSQRAVKSGLDDIGDTYIEIDYSSQHLWFYDEGKLKYQTDIVSGNINRQNGSVDGVYKIAYKQRDAVLRGEDYESAVKYFMPFAYNIGIHDASWRSSFGGEIYKKSGSHGCINVPYKAAEELFAIVPKGTPVVAYYREPVQLTNNAARVSNAFSYVKPEE